MAESSIYWDTNATGDGLVGGYTETQMFQFLRSIFTANATHLGGVAPDFADKLAVSGSSSPVAVATGAALVYGIPYFNTASVNVAVATPAGATRIDRVVLRASWSAQTVRIALVAGSEGGAAPALTQSAGTTWEIPLAQVSITTGGAITVTDERVWLSLVGDLAVTTGKIAADAVTNAKIADDSIDSEHYVDGSIDTAHIGDLQVTTGKIADLGVTTGKIAADAVTNAKIGDDQIDSEHYVDGSIDTAHIADDAVTGDKVGDRVAQVHRRMGGNASSWLTAGTTTYTPGAVRIQAGSVSYNYGGAADGVFNITFPVAFSATPLFFATATADASAVDDNSKILVTSAINAGVATSSAARIIWRTVDGDTVSTVTFFWWAIGPE